jgi:methylmalonyl-CoA mutase
MDKEKLFAGFPPVNSNLFKEQILRDLKGKDYGSVLFRTSDDLIFEPFYTGEDLENSPLQKHLPGVKPFLRGNKRFQNHWEIRQDINTEDSAAANKKALDILNKGVTSLGFSGRNLNIETLLKDILIEYIEVNFNEHSEAEKNLLNLLEYSKNRNLSPLQIRGSVNYNPLAVMAEAGALEENWEEKVTSLADVLVKSGSAYFRGINVSGEIFHEAGATIIQELAFTLSQGVEYLALLTNRGFNIDQIAPVYGFTFSTGSAYLPEIAKLRAFRLLWANVIESYKPQHDCTCATYVHCKTSGRSLSIADAYNNLLRATTQTMTAAIGGADAVSVTPFDAAYQDSGEFSERLARNIQIICAEEAFLNKVADPAGGSYYLEKLTETIASAAWGLFKIVESKGGYIAALKEGFIQSEIEESAKKAQEEVLAGKTLIVGVNKYVNKQESIKAFTEQKAEQKLGNSIKPLVRVRLSEQVERTLSEQQKQSIS